MISKLRVNLVNSGISEADSSLEGNIDQEWGGWVEPMKKEGGGYCHIVGTS